jgi:hypothetical protein
MKRHDDDSFDELWLKRLDRIAGGKEMPGEDEDELLRLAGQVSEALAPLREVGGRDEEARERLRRRLYSLQLRSGVDWRRTRMEQGQGQGRRFRAVRWYVLAAVVAVVLLMVGVVRSGGLAGVQDGWQELWHTSTSLDQITGISASALERPRAGVRPLPLLPDTLPGDTQGVSYGIITDQADRNLLTAFIANYHIAGQDVLLYEEPADTALTSSVATPLAIGNFQGLLFRDGKGTAALQWYESGMQCQLTAKVSVAQLVAIARTVEPLSSWERIL